MRRHSIATALLVTALAAATFAHAQGPAQPASKPAAGGSSTGAAPQTTQPAPAGAGLGVGAAIAAAAAAVAIASGGGGTTTTTHHAPVTHSP